MTGNVVDEVNQNSPAIASRAATVQRTRTHPSTRAQHCVVKKPENTAHKQGISAPWLQIPAANDRPLAIPGKPRPRCVTPRSRRLHVDKTPRWVCNYCDRRRTLWVTDDPRGPGICMSRAGHVSATVYQEDDHGSVSARRAKGHHR